MTAYVLGVGLGLFILLALWATAIVLCIVSIRTDKSLGPIIVLIAVVVTLVLVLIPREPETPQPPVEKLYDHLFVWRVLLVIGLGLSAAAASTVALLSLCLEPRLATPIKGWTL